MSALPIWEAGVAPRKRACVAEPGQLSAEVALGVRDLSVRYGGTEALVGASLVVAPREVVALIGANGAGKSSLLKAICGIVSCVGGTVRCGGVDVTGLPAHLRVRHGMALVPEGRGVFRDLTVAENLELGAFLRHTAPQRAAVANDLARVLELFPRLRERSGLMAGSLSGGEQQMLSIGRALMTAPRLLVLDEPSLGLAPKVVDEIVAALRSLNTERGLAILVAEQNAALGLGIADRGYVLHNGRIVLEGCARDLVGKADLINVYLGIEIDQAKRRGHE